eukprot:CAMPEP_0183569756 /NCGR_PEP_ID=MMETSP0371-20130417/121172_1 /TAXON_ID=268820 /ORGANISM="Peridinium aciculiferum, Strain PAER-2" /LENGTH=158 /DNA_ID=CAMNT_0025779375 /DNA_START=198 /DNA_END=675 /DNA_ORIENTATION=-
MQPPSSAVRLQREEREAVQRPRQTDGKGHAHEAVERDDQALAELGDCCWRLRHMGPCSCQGQRPRADHAVDHPSTPKGRPEQAEQSAPHDACKCALRRQDDPAHASSNHVVVNNRRRQPRYSPGRIIQLEWEQPVGLNRRTEKHREAKGHACVEGHKG